MNHWDNIDERCLRIVQRCVEVLDNDSVDFTLVGGWAVYSHVPSVPSVDTDIIIRGGNWDAARQTLETEGFQIGHQKEIEPLQGTDRVGYWAFGDEDLQIPTPGFEMDYAAEGTQARRELAFSDWSHEVNVPSPGGLALMKTCALHNRDLALRSFSDGTAGMLLGPDRIGLIRQMSESYYLRKAGKDLFDLGLLLSQANASDELWNLAKNAKVDEVLPQLLAPLAAATIREAEDIASRGGEDFELDQIRASLSS